MAASQGVIRFPVSENTGPFQLHQKVTRMSSTPKPFPTIAERWREHVRISGLDKALPKRELTLAMLMFYAGFSACLDAGLEIAEHSDDQAMQLLQAMHVEVKQLESKAGEVLAAGLAP